MHIELFLEYYDSNWMGCKLAKTIFTNLCMYGGVRLLGNKHTHKHGRTHKIGEWVSKRVRVDIGFWTVWSINSFFGASTTVVRFSIFPYLAFYSLYLLHSHTIVHVLHDHVFLLCSGSNKKRMGLNAWSLFFIRCICVGISIRIPYIPVRMIHAYPYAYNLMFLPQQNKCFVYNN